MSRSFLRQQVNTYLSIFFVSAFSCLMLFVMLNVGHLESTITQTNGAIPADEYFAY